MRRTKTALPSLVYYAHLSVKLVLPIPPIVLHAGYLLEDWLCF